MHSCSVVYCGPEVRRPVDCKGSQGERGMKIYIKIYVCELYGISHMVMLVGIL